ncbi:MAG: HAD hydrolase-like protein [Rhodothermia bacterium]|nr:HAD hydrolase-like protein [Rhodothermia bacterium]
MPARKLILFDIDGTLLTTNGRGREAFRAAIEDTFDRPFDDSQVSFAGKTDQQILGEILQTMGINGAPGGRTWTRALDLYRSLMLARLTSEEVVVLPGVRELLRRLSEIRHVQLGLLTGNLEDMAYHKLRLASLDAHFPFGAFGSDHADRYQLPAIAVARAANHVGYGYEGEEVVIVGDTEHDIGCAKASSALAVAVCTGRTSRPELEHFRPHVLLDDLSETDRFLRVIVNRP